MKANITYLKNMFDDESKVVTVYGKSREAIYGICDSLGEKFVLINVYITEEKTEEKKEN